MFEKFVAWMDYEWKVKGLESLMAFMSKKYSLKIDDLMKDANDFVSVRKEEVKKTDIREQYETQLKALQEAYGEAMLELPARKKWNALLAKKDEA